MKTIITDWLRGRGLLRWHDKHADGDLLTIAGSVAGAGPANQFDGLYEPYQDIVKCSTCPALTTRDSLVYRQGPESTADYWGRRMIGQCLECVAVDRIINGRAEWPRPAILPPRRRHAAAARPAPGATLAYRVTFDRIGDRCSFETGLPHDVLHLDITADPAHTDPVITQIREQIVAHAAKHMAVRPTVWFFPDGDAPLDGLDGCSGSLLNTREHTVGSFRLQEMARVSS